MQDVEIYDLEMCLDKEAFEKYDRFALTQVTESNPELYRHESAAADLFLSSFFFVF